jgi:hypothetical protein
MTSNESLGLRIFAFREESQHRAWRLSWVAGALARAGFAWGPAMAMALLLSGAATWQEAGDSPEPAAQDPEIKSFSYPTPRMSVRGLVYHLGENLVPTIHGQFLIHYNQPKWQPAYDTGFDALTLGKRWRFCIDFWTALDTNAPLTIGGTRFGVGEYYLVLDRAKDGSWSLVLMDAAAVRAKKLDATQAESTTEGTKVPMTYAKLDKHRPELEIELVTEAKEPRQFTMVVRLGLTSDLPGIGSNFG